MRQVAKTVKKALNEAEYLDNDEELLDEYRDEWNYVMHFLYLQFSDESFFAPDNDTLLAYYYEEIPIDYKRLAGKIAFTIDRPEKLSPEYLEGIEEYKNTMPHIYSELQKYPNTKYKNVFDRCVRIVIQHILEERDLI